MNEAMIGMIVKSLGLKPEAVQGLVVSLSQGVKQFEDIKILLADKLEVDKRILDELKASHFLLREIASNVGISLLKKRGDK